MDQEWKSREEAPPGLKYLMREAGATEWVPTSEGARICIRSPRYNTCRYRDVTAAQIFAAEREIDESPWPKQASPHILSKKDAGKKSRW